MMEAPLSSPSPSSSDSEAASSSSSKNQQEEERERMDSEEEEEENERESFRAKRKKKQQQPPHATTKAASRSFDYGARSYQRGGGEEEEEEAEEGQRWLRGQRRSAMHRRSLQVEEEEEEEETVGESFRRRNHGKRWSAGHHRDSRFYEGREEEEGPGPGTTLFGIKPWNNIRASSSSFSEPTTSSSDSLVMVSNVAWLLVFGWMASGAYFLIGAFLFCTVVARPYAYLCFDLARYYLWPFGKYILRRSQMTSATSIRPLVAHHNSEGNDEDDDEASLREEASYLVGSDASSTSKKTNNNDYRSFAYSAYTGPSDQLTSYRNKPSYPKAATVLWYIFVPLLALMHIVTMCICWMIVVFIPMAKLNKNAIMLLFQNPLDTRVSDSPSGNIVMCTYQAGSYRYYKYNAIGFNVILLNLLSFVVISLIVGYVLPHRMQPSPIILFCTSILSIIPLAYYIGMAVASIAAQTNFAIGAMLNAMFGVSIEIILYGMAIMEGGLTDLIQAGVLGSLLGDLLLLPGLSMIAGGIKYKEQKFSPAAAGVSSVLLIISVIGVFTPTIFWGISGEFAFDCNDCEPMNATKADSPLTCRSCVFLKVDYGKSEDYLDRARPLMYTCAAVLPIAYLVGLLFTLKTHSFLFDNVNEEEEGHDNPGWSKLKAIAILLCSVTLFALISEKAIEAIEPALESLGIEQIFAGITIMALVPSTAEYVNAIGFALKNNVALSLEIGATSAVQIALIMVPVLVGFSGLYHHGSPDNSMTLIFPSFAFFAIIMSVLIINYISIEGKANYFKGVALVVCYVLFIAAFYFTSVRGSHVRH
ncbi:Low affinity vacuolar monovalent cation/H(+) antiporter [Balamuthia mandrillaris]